MGEIHPATQSTIALYTSQSGLLCSGFARHYGFQPCSFFCYELFQLDSRDQIKPDQIVQSKQPYFPRIRISHTLSSSVSEIPQYIHEKGLSIHSMAKLVCLASA